MADMETQNTMELLQSGPGVCLSAVAPTFYPFTLYFSRDGKLYTIRLKKWKIII